jgi:hypothetical protein
VEEIPEGAPVVPVRIIWTPDPETVLEPEPEEEILIELDEPIPLGSGLPQTGQLPAGAFYGAGSLLGLIGVGLKKIIKK